MNLNACYSSTPAAVKYLHKALVSFGLIVRTLMHARDANLLASFTRERLAGG